VVAIWNDIRDAARADFYEWHNREHMPERVAIGGFRRGRRYVALDGEPQYFTLYETDGLHVTNGAEYLARLNAPTAWTQRVTQSFFNVSRSLCAVELTAGVGQGGSIVTWRYDVRPGLEEAQRAFLRPALLAVAEAPGVVGAHLCVTDRAGSMVPTAEKQARAEPNRVPGWVVLVEGGSDADALVTACARALPDAAFEHAGADASPARGLYALQCSREKHDAQAHAADQSRSRSP